MTRLSLNYKPKVNKGGSPIICVLVAILDRYELITSRWEEYTPTIHVLNRNKNISILTISFNVELQTWLHTLSYHDSRVFRHFDTHEKRLRFPG